MQREDDIRYLMRRAQQKALEKEAVGTGIKQYQERVARSSENVTAPGLQLKRSLLDQFAIGIEDYLNARIGKPGPKPVPFKMLRELNHPVSAAWNALGIILTGVEQRKTDTNIAQSLGERIAILIEVKDFEETDPQTVKRQVKKICNYKWEPQELQNTGQQLLHICEQSTGLITTFTEKVGTKARPKTQVLVTLSTEFQRMLDEGHEFHEMLNMLFWPTVIAPVPWKTIDGGGYHFEKLLKDRKVLRFVKTRNEKHLEKLYEQDMPEVYSAVNALQNTPWQINKEVVRIFKQVWALRGPERKRFRLPPRKPRNLPPKPTKRQKELHTKEISKRLTLAAQLCVVERFFDDEEIFFVHSLDWRSRIYAVPSFVNMQGDDVARAFLQFADGLPLGDKGEHWLAVHGANLYGHGLDKRPLRRRVAWVHEHCNEIVESAREPLGCGNFWVKAKKQWQFLAFCFEWARYKKEGQSFRSHLPVMLDGSNNGHQHLSALLRDERGAVVTNLIRHSNFRDMYREVAKKVKEMVEEDHLRAETDRNWRPAGVDKKISHRKLRKTISECCGKIDRNLVKHGAMTRPYGSTEWGIARNLKKYLLQKEARRRPMVDPKMRFHVCQYLSPLILEAVDRVVPATPTVINWLKQVVDVMNKAGLSVSWQTPVGFPVVQDYKKTERLIAYMPTGKERILKVNTDQIDDQQQKTSITPNLVHSLDATHLVMTVNRCAGEGIGHLATVHDAFATHACHAGKLSKIVRETFVELYKTNRLEEFRAQIAEQLPEELAAELPPTPPQGCLDIGNVLKAKLAFS